MLFVHPLDPAHGIGGRCPGPERLVELRVVGPAGHAQPHLHLGPGGAGDEREHPEPDSKTDPHAAVLSRVRGEAMSHPATAIAIPAALAKRAVGPPNVW